jgi:hypothetical protein
MSYVRLRSGRREGRGGGGKREGKGNGAELTAPKVCLNNSSPTVQSLGIEYVFHTNPTNDATPPHHQPISPPPHNTNDKGKDILYVIHILKL